MSRETLSGCRGNSSLKPIMSREIRDEWLPYFTINLSHNRLVPAIHHQDCPIWSTFLNLLFFLTLSSHVILDFFLKVFTLLGSIPKRSVVVGFVIYMHTQHYRSILLLMIIQIFFFLKIVCKSVFLLSPLFG